MKFSFISVTGRRSQSSLQSSKHEHSHTVQVSDRVPEQSEGCTCSGKGRNLCLQLAQAGPPTLLQLLQLCMFVCENRGEKSLRLDALHEHPNFTKPGAVG